MCRSMASLAYIVASEGICSELNRELLSRHELLPAEWRVCLYRNSSIQQRGEKRLHIVELSSRPRVSRLVSQNAEISSGFLASVPPVWYSLGVGPSRILGYEASSGPQAASAPQGQDVVAVVVSLPLRRSE